MSKRLLVLWMVWILVLGIGFEGLAQEQGIRKEKEELLFEEIPIVVTASLREQPITEAPAIMSVISEEEIKNMGARDLQDVLRTVPGLETYVSYLGTQFIAARGIKTIYGEKILLMIDGYPVNGNFFGSGFLRYDYMPVDIIKRVEVIRGPGSALYGANAFMAVINVITRKAEDNNEVISVNARAGSFNTQEYNFLFGKQIGELKVSIFVDYLTTDGIDGIVERDAQSATDDQLAPFGFPSVSLAPGKVRDKLEKTQLFLNLSYLGWGFKGGFLTRVKQPYMGILYTLTDDSHRDAKTMFGEVSYQRPLGEKFDLLTRLYADKHISEMRYKGVPEGFINPDPYDLDGDGQIEVFPDGILGYADFDDVTMGTEIRISYQATDNNRLTLGGTLENRHLFNIRYRTNTHPLYYTALGSLQDVSSWANYIPESERDIWALYVQDVWNISRKVGLTLGLRHDHYSDFGGTTNPRAALVWELAQDTYLKLLYGQAFRAPSFTELYLINNPRVVGSPDLKPEEIKTIEVGLESKIVGNLYGRINYYHNTIEALIVEGPKTGPLGAAVYANKSGKVVIQGVEFELRNTFSKGSYAYLNWSYQDPRDKELNQRLPEVPTHKGNLGVNIELGKHLNVNGYLFLIGKRPRDAADSRGDLPGYGLVNLTLILKEFYKGLEVTGSIYNLLDKDYVEPSPVGSMPSDFPQSGRSFVVTSSYKF